jgi:hypothetical protein
VTNNIFFVYTGGYPSPETQLRRSTGWWMGL